MIRIFALLVVAATWLAGVGPSSAQDADFRDFFRAVPNFGYSGSGPIARTVVSFDGRYAPGTIYINTAERRLYLVLGNGQALRYGIGVGRDGFRWSGVHHISAKKEWPSWTPPAQMRARRPDLPRYMAGGINNPLGSRAMYLGSRLDRIHGSNGPGTHAQGDRAGWLR